MQFTIEQISTAINKAADDIQAFAADNGHDYEVTVDLTNLMVNAALTYLHKPDGDLATVIADNFEQSDLEDDSWREMVARRLP